MARSSVLAIAQFVQQLIDDPNGETFSLSQVVAALDALRKEHRYTRLTPLVTRSSGGTSTYLIYDAPSYLETDAVVLNSNYDALTPSAVDYTAGRFTFSSEPVRPVRLVGWEHDPYGAAADLLEQHATSEAGNVQSFNSQNGSFTYAAKNRNFQRQADRYRSMSKRGSGSVAVLVRWDANNEY